MITKDSIETAYSFLHQKRNVYIHSTLDWQKTAIKREQSDVNISSAESRERKSEAQFDQEDGLFKFEKRKILN